MFQLASCRKFDNFHFRPAFPSILFAVAFLFLACSEPKKATHTAGLVKLRRPRPERISSAQLLQENKPEAASETSKVIPDSTHAHPDLPPPKRPQSKPQIEKPAAKPIKQEDQAASNISLYPAAVKPGGTLTLKWPSGLELQPNEAMIRWYQGETLLAKQVASYTAKNHKKNDKIDIVVTGKNWQKKLSTVILNRKPNITGFGKLQKRGEFWVVTVKASDPDRDKLHIELPGIAAGVMAVGMEIRIHNDTIRKIRSLPVTVTDGQETAAFLYTPQLPDWADNP